MIEEDDEDPPHIAPRRPFNPNAPVREDVIHCYGVDFMSNKDVLEAFAGFGPEEIEWLDDSSCNVVFDSPDAAEAALDGLVGEVVEADSEQSPWRRTRRLPIGPKSKICQEGMPPAPHGVRLELRKATEADRKDPTHSGHNDSAYYHHVKEQQAQKKQRKEQWHRNKRQRQQQHLRAKAAEATPEIAPPPPQNAVLSTPQDEKSALIAGRVPGQDAGGETETQATYPETRLGRRGVLDPLLFLRAGAKEPKVEGETEPEDLKSILQRQEEEYAAPAAPSLETKADFVAGSRARRQRGGPPGDSGGAPMGGGSVQQRRKRRATTQEPRTVTSAAPPKRGPQALPAIESFLKARKLQAKRFQVRRTFRGIVYGQQKQAKQLAAGTGGPGAAEEEPPPWEQYLAGNRFTENRQLMHTIAWDAAGRRVLTVIPHPMRVDGEKLAAIVKLPATQLRQRKLKDIQRETGFPTFVCPPFGHPPDAEGREPMLLVDSCVVELRKPLLFDCGSVALSIRGDDFLRCTRAACIEGLAKADAGSVAARLAQPLPPVVPIVANPFAAVPKGSSLEEGEVASGAPAGGSPRGLACSRENEASLVTPTAQAVPMCAAAGTGELLTVAPSGDADEAMAAGLGEAPSLTLRAPALVAAAAVAEDEATRARGKRRPPRLPKAQGTAAGRCAGASDGSVGAASGPSP